MCGAQGRAIMGGRAGCSSGGAVKGDHDFIIAAMNVDGSRCLAKTGGKHVGPCDTDGTVRECSAIEGAHDCPVPLKYDHTIHQLPCQCGSEGEVDLNTRVAVDSRHMTDMRDGIRMPWNVQAQKVVAGIQPDRIQTVAFKTFLVRKLRRTDEALAGGVIVAQNDDLLLGHRIGVAVI